MLLGEERRGVKGGGRYYELAPRGHNSELYQNIALSSMTKISKQEYRVQVLIMFTMIPF